VRLGFYGGSFGALRRAPHQGLRADVQPRIINDARIERVFRPLRTIPKEEIERSRAIVETIAPVYYVGHAAPSALFYETGDKDFGSPRESAGRLFKAASEPKVIRWWSLVRN
jgi:hypothetical protein